MRGPRRQTQGAGAGHLAGTGSARVSVDPCLPLLGASSEPASLRAHCSQGSSQSEMLTGPPGPLGSERSRALNSGPSDPRRPTPGPHTRSPELPPRVSCLHEHTGIHSRTPGSPAALRAAAWSWGDQEQQALTLRTDTQVDDAQAVGDGSPSSEPRPGQGGRAAEAGAG